MMVGEDRYKWLRNYGVVTVLGLGLAGGFFIWAVNAQVEAQTSELRADNAVFKVRLETIQKAQQETDQRLKRLEDGQRDLRAEVKTLQEGQLSLRADVKTLQVGLLSLRTEVREAQAAILQAIENQNRPVPR